MKPSGKKPSDHLRLPFEQPDPPRPVLDKARARCVTERGIALAEANAPDGWRSELKLAIERVARRTTYFTSDDLWVEVGEAVMARGNTSALGGIFREVAKDGSIESTSEYRESQRPAHHRKPLRVWRSRMFAR